jgi:ketol-acid reductoisomerase
VTEDSASIRFFTKADNRSGSLDRERLAVIGYGNLGRALALNLRDSMAGDVGQDSGPVFVGNVPDEYAETARSDGFEVLAIGEAVAAADVVLVLLPDEVIPEVFAAEIGPRLAPGAAIVFASGYCLAYGLIDPPAGVDVLMLAPRMGGELARDRYLEGRGFFAYVSAERDASGRAWERLLGLCDATGVLQAGAMELDAQREANLDLFVEQTMGAVIGVAIMNAFNLGVEAGIPPEAMVLEMYMSGEMETVFAAFRKRGFYRASDTHGPTALYGGFVRTMELIESNLYDRFLATLEDIQSGGFARQFQAEREAGYPTLTQAQAMSSEESPITRPMVEAETNVRVALEDS